MSSVLDTPKKTACYHCGQDCHDEHIRSDEKLFCCEGCKMVFEIINQNGLCEYYDISKSPGISQKVKVREGKFSFLDNSALADKLIHFKNGKQCYVTFYLPQMHCSSCIWILEQLHKLNRGVVNSTVNFLKKEVTVIYHSEKMSLRTLAELLTGIGYEPHISWSNIDGKVIKHNHRSRIYKIGLAGFCFGNIMLLSFPEYFSSGEIQEKNLKFIFTYINLVLSLPVFFYCASGFFVSAYKGLRHGFLNIDAPIALAIFITFSRSTYEIVTHSGAGYLDSMSGIVFFMLVGRFFQDRTYESLSFERDYKSYFPLCVTKRDPEKGEISIPVSDISKGDRLLIHSQEIIPADGILFVGQGNIDYSFVTGESLLSEKGIGELVYAGGRQTGASIEMEVVKEVSQSYLTQLWNNEVFTKKRTEKKVSFVHGLSRAFTYILFSIAVLTALYWASADRSKIWNAVTSVLIVACPCALLLSATFTNGNMLARLQRRGFFIKNASVLESMSDINSLVFDKTGTISLQSESRVEFKEGKLSPYEEQLVRSVTMHSNHPLSKAVAASLPDKKQLPLKEFEEIKGKGMVARINYERIKIGSEQFVTGQNSLSDPQGMRVYVAVDEEVLGYFEMKTRYRKGLDPLISELRHDYSLSLISGDNRAEEKTLRKIFGRNTKLFFEQSPQQKLDYIKKLQRCGKKVMMIGDGLNDAGALQQSDVGVVVSDDINNFSPGCDAILEGRRFAELKKLLDYCRKEKGIIYGSFTISILYNLAGLYVAVQGNLSPVIAAVLMPLSSVCIVIYASVMSAWFARKF